MARDFRVMRRRRRRLQWRPLLLRLALSREPLFQLLASVMLTAYLELWAAESCNLLEKHTSSENKKTLEENCFETDDDSLDIFQLLFQGVNVDDNTDPAQVSESRARRVRGITQRRRRRMRWRLRLQWRPLLLRSTPSREPVIQLLASVMLTAYLELWAAESCNLLEKHSSSENKKTLEENCCETDDDSLDICQLLFQGVNVDDNTDPAQVSESRARRVRGITQRRRRRMRWRLRLQWRPLLLRLTPSREPVIQLLASVMLTAYLELWAAESCNLLEKHSSSENKKTLEENCCETDDDSLDICQGVNVDDNTDSAQVSESRARRVRGITQRRHRRISCRLRLQWRPLALSRHLTVLRRPLCQLIVWSMVMSLLTSQTSNVEMSDESLDILELEGRRSEGQVGEIDSGVNVEGNTDPTQVSDREEDASFSGGPCHSE